MSLHHIIVPSTGLPADSCWRAVSVAAATCVDANTASTAAILRGERAVGWLDGAAPARAAGPSGRHDGHDRRVARCRARQADRARGRPRMSFSLHGPGLWYATRAAGLVTMLLLTCSVLLGVLTAGRFAGDRWPRFVTVGLHRNLSLLVLVFLALHIVTIVIDTYHLDPAGGRLHTVRHLLQDDLDRARRDRPRSAGRRHGHQPDQEPAGVPRVALGALARLHLLADRAGARPGLGTDRGTLWVVELTVACIAVVAGAAFWRIVSAARAGAR